MRRTDPAKKNFRESSLRIFYKLGRVIRSRFVSTVVRDNRVIVCTPFLEVFPKGV
jgi:hypothetical protein